MVTPESRVFRRRRERQEFERQALAAADGARPGVEAAVAEARAALEQTRAELVATPGAAARCPECGARMQLQRTKQGRNWWTLWRCPRCRETYRPSDFSEAARAGGWQ
jgi:tRNA(Ile2) C34 agmatinyltransferase TiaS